MPADRLKTYRDKRDFDKTAEPAGKVGAASGRRYLIQKHDATRLHFDFRLEHDGVLLSWAVTKGPSLDPAEKRLAVHVEDHPLDYGDFEGTIPKGEYGGGTVMLWDEGTWEPVEDVDKGLKAGKLAFVLHGERLRGGFALVRLRPRPGSRDKRENWLLVKERDEYAGTEAEPIIERELTSVRTGRTMEEIAAGEGEKPRRKNSVAATVAPAKVSSRKPAKTLPLPKFVEPELATLVDIVPEGAGWVHEIKFDGYRMLGAVGDGRAALYTRKGLNWAERFPGVTRALEKLPVRSALLDGEVAVADGEGRTDFGALQAAIGNQDSLIAYHVFDLLELDGEDLRKRPLLERKARLAELLKGVPEPLAYSDHVEGRGKDMFANACAMGLEGIVSKQANAPYHSGRVGAWLKIKCANEQELVILGWRPSDVAGRPFSSILVGVREGDGFRYAGRVGTGFDARKMKELAAELSRRATDKPAAADIPREIRRDARYVRPELVAEVAFRGWTKDRLVRQAAYKGLRWDKKAGEVVAELPAPLPASASPGRKPRSSGKSPERTALDAGLRRNGGGKRSGRGSMAATVHSPTVRSRDAVEVEGVRITHPDKVLYADQGVTKQTLIDYYAAVAERMLPHIAGRPLSLVRCPDGANKQCFFQKHASAGFPDAFKHVRITDFSGPDQYLYIEDERGLFAAVQVGVLELHLWGSKVGDLDRPDRLVFDLDPGEGVSFDTLKSAAVEMRDRLKKIGLTSFPMPTGGKGIHVVAPLTPRAGWEDVKTFAEAMARIVSADAPEKYLATMAKADRAGRIFIDYLRNQKGATAISPYSTRSRAGATVAWPMSWAGLGRLGDPHPASVETAAKLLKRIKDPWAGYFEIEQVLPTEKLKKLS